MSNINPDILRKIKKCLALSASDNEGEASNALRQAQRLMDLHGVSPSALAGADIGTAKAKSTACTKPAAWENTLAHLLAEAFGCEVIIHRGWFNKVTNSNGALAEFVYIGLHHNSLTASYAHDVLRRQVVKARAAFLKTWEADYILNWGCAPALRHKIAAGDAFTLGYVSNVGRQVSALTIDPAHEKAIQARKEELLGPDWTITRSNKRGFSRDAYEAGSEAGKDAQLHRPMDKAEDQLKLN